MTTLQKTLIASLVAVAVAVGVSKLHSTFSSKVSVVSVQPLPVSVDDMVTTASGLRYQVLKRGSGTVTPKATDKVRVHYHGTLLDGTVFDSSVDRGQPMIFPVDSVIAGWTEGIQLMVVGDMFKFEIPPKLGYGDERSKRSKIPPSSTLVFEVELLEIQ